MNTSADARYMARALQLARRGVYTTDPNPRVGCVVVKDDRIVGEGWHERAGEPHAEIHALAHAGEAARGATVYITLEPCCHHGRTPPCTEALIQAGVSRVMAAMQDPNPVVAGDGMAVLRKAGVEVECPLLSEQAEALNPGFIMRMRHGRPYVRVKQAMSLDGRTAMASGESRWITGEAARRDVHRLRARSSAVLTGINTVLADDPALNARLDDSRSVEQPLRVVLDSHLRLPVTAHMLTIAIAGPILVLTGREDEGPSAALREKGAEVSVIPQRNGRADLSRVMDLLALMEINEVLVEAGPTLCGALLQAGLVDELIVYLAPTLLGDSARGLMNLPGLAAMADRIQLDIMDIRAVGRDWRITAKPVQ